MCHMGSEMPRHSARLLRPTTFDMLEQFVGIHFDVARRPRDIRVCFGWAATEPREENLERFEVFCLKAKARIRA